MAFDLPFASKTPPLIGLDIGSSSVKIVELSEEKALGGIGLVVVSEKTERMEKQS